jgi:radical SAM protein with 4Fe4S-binding SPASM domain
MDFDLFKKIAIDLTHFPQRLKMINLYKDGESLIHPKFCDMVRVLRAMDVSEKIWLKTNGALLSPEMNKDLVSCGLDMIGISVQHVHAQGFFDVAGVKINYDEYRANILDLYNRRGDVKVSIKIADVGLSDNDKQRFFDDFSDRCDFITVEGLHGWSASTVKDWKLGTDKSFDGTPRNEKIACPLVLYMMTVNSNGKISVCNDDWMQAHNIGDVNKESLINIWNGERFRNFRIMHMEGRRAENISCNGCDYIHALPDNIDAERLQILKKL